MREQELRTGERGLTLRLCAWGAPSEDRLPILILHGYLEQGAAWDAVARALGPRHVVAPDHRGHGLSEHVGAGGFYHFWDYVPDVDAVVEHLGGRVDLVGHSMGGSMAVLYAACAPDRVRRLVLVEGLGPPDGDARAVEQARTSLRHRRRPPSHRGISDVDEAITRMRRGNPDLPVEVARGLAERQTRPAGEDNPGDALTWTWDALHRARSPAAFSAARFMQFLAAIEAPTLMVEGGRSPYQHIPDLAERRASLQDARTVVLPDCGHHPHHTHVPALADLIREHLDAGA